MLSLRRLGGILSTRPHTVWAQRQFSSSIVMRLGNKDDDEFKKRLHPARKMSEMPLEDVDTRGKKHPGEKSTTDLESPPKTKRLDAIDAVNTGTYIPKDWRKMNLPDWKRQKYALAEKFDGKGWNPNKKLSRETMQSVRILKAKLPDLTSSELSQHFEVSVEAIRRILKSKWAPKSGEEEDKVMERWKKRKERVKMALNEKGTGADEIVPEYKNIVVLNSGQEFTRVKTARSNKDFMSQRRPKNNAKSRLAKVQGNQIRKMEF